MQENFFDGSDDIQDISSTSREFRERNAGPVSNYKKGIFKNIGMIVKAISFIVAFAIIIVSFVIAFFLFSKEVTYMAISLAVIIFGTVFALITMFLIYGMGHILCQNEELIKRLKR